MSTISKSCCQTGGAGRDTWSGDRRVVFAAIAAMGGAALWFGWPWLVVAGIAPLLIAIAPCLLMCGAMCAIKACCKPTQTASLAQTDTKLLTQEAADPQASVPALPQFSRNSMQFESTAETRMPA